MANGKKSVKKVKKLFDEREAKSVEKRLQEGKKHHTITVTESSIQTTNNLTGEKITIEVIDQKGAD